MTKPLTDSQVTYVKRLVAAAEERALIAGYNLALKVESDRFSKPLHYEVAFQPPIRDRRGYYDLKTVCVGASGREAAIQTAAKLLDTERDLCYYACFIP